MPFSTHSKLLEYMDVPDKEDDMIVVETKVDVCTLQLQGRLWCKPEDSS